jgi:parvulin-like peptidyl-prolyl isomerase
MKTCGAMRAFVLVFLAFCLIASVQALAEEPSSTEDEARRARVFARIGETTITVGDIEDLVASRRPYARKRLTEKPERLKEAADAQVESELFFQGAEKLGYADAKRVERYVNQTLVKVYVRKEFEETVRPEDIPLTEVAKYYEEHSDEFRRPEMRRARHILVASKADAEEVLQIVKVDKSKTFRALAKDRSIDTETNIRGGDLLYFTSDGSVVGREESGKIDATIAKAAFELEEKGDFAGPLDLGDDKWSVLELTAIRPERVQTLDTASNTIRMKLWREEREGALETHINELRAEVKPEVHPEKLDLIKVTPPAEPVDTPKP